MSASFRFTVMTRRQSASRGIRLAGFTLLELLVSSTILLTLLVLLLGATEASSRLWNRAEQRRAPLREAGTSLHLIGHDLRSAVITPDPGTFLIRKDKASGTRAESLFFLVSHSPEGHGKDCIGDLCATGYFIAPSAEEKGSRNLYRFHASGRAVLDAVHGEKLPELYATAAPGSANTELLARHVEGLEFELLETPDSKNIPRGLRMTIGTVDGSTAREIAGLDAADREAFLLKNGTRLSKIVPLPAPRDLVNANQRP